MLFDCPGQVELFTHHGSLRNIFMRIQKIGYRVSACPSPHVLWFLVPDREIYEALMAFESARW